MNVVPLQQVLRSSRQRCGGGLRRRLLAQIDHRRRCLGDCVAATAQDGGRPGRLPGWDPPFRAVRRGGGERRQSQNHSRPRTANRAGANNRLFQVEVATSSSSSATGLMVVEVPRSACTTFGTTWTPNTSVIRSTARAAVRCGARARRRSSSTFSSATAWFLANAAIRTVDGQVVHRSGVAAGGVVDQNSAVVNDPSSAGSSTSIRGRGLQVAHDRLLRAAGDHHHCSDIGIVVLLTMWRVRRHEDIIARRGAEPGLLPGPLVKKNELRMTA